MFSPYSLSNSASCFGFRAAATTRSPALSTASVNARPRPREAPVMSQTFDIDPLSAVHRPAPNREAVKVRSFDSSAPTELQGKLRMPVFLGVGDLSQKGRDAARWAGSCVPLFPIPTCELFAQRNLLEFADAGARDFREEDERVRELPFRKGSSEEGAQFFRRSRGPIFQD